MAKPAIKPKDESLPAGSKPSAKPPSPGDNSASAEQLKSYYRDMLLIRRFEERAGQLYGMGLIGGFCHLYIGQEAVVVGMQSTIDAKDSIVTSYRDHGHMLAAGMDPKGVMSELTGRSTGYSKGKGGSMHMFSREKNFYGGHGIVGAQVPIGTGLAFVHKYNGAKNVALTYFGDGSANQGQVYEAMNMAALWKLPVISSSRTTLRHGHLGRSASATTDLYRHGGPSASPASASTAWTCWRWKRREGGRIRPRRQGPSILEMQTYATAAIR
jgi:pyruvate dehydrogenase E1 component alpha subunit